MLFLQLTFVLFHQLLILTISHVPYSREYVTVLVLELFLGKSVSTIVGAKQKKPS